MNKNYIKMCTEAKELQEIWEPVWGEAIFNDYSGHEEMVSMDIYCSYWEGLNEDKWDVVKDKSIVWLPSQEKLQSLILKRPNFVNTSQLKLLSKMRIQIAKDYCDGYLNSCSLNEMWLLFYMKVFYNKTWCADNWKEM